AISLNSLLLWNVKDESIGQKYKKEFEKRNKEEFDWMTHSIAKTREITSNQKLSVSIVEADLYLNPREIKKSIATNLSFTGGIGETPYQVIELNPGAQDEKISWSFSDFINEKGEKISQKDIAINELVFQYTSPDNNHETYLITGKYLKPLIDHSFLLKKKNNKYLWLQLNITNKLPRGIYKGEMLFHHGNEAHKFPVEVNILPYELPKIDFPVGFFGLDPLPFTYFNGIGYSELRKKFRYLALEAIGQAGFTTFTGLPSETAELDELFKASAKWGIDTVYSYGGLFPSARLDLSKKAADMSDDAYFEKASKDLKILLAKKNWPKIVYTFSDEAGGYSDKVATDLALARKLKKYFPFMALGGFGSFTGEDSKQLNAFFDYGFYSSLAKSDILKLKDNNRRWGLYNTSPGNLDDPRFSFGLGLYIARQNGLSQYLEWHSSSVSNYPYYDFDGRESDVVMFYPTSSGKLLHSLRFEMASEGLHAFKKLKLLEDAVENHLGPSDKNLLAKKWLTTLIKENYFYSSNTFLSNKKNNFRELDTKINEHLKNIYMKK
ncbi:MAG: DUF4091 domain-containing protein, partial [Bacteriovorax sp.]|nr:DUF4091 domain-containing protein [Bacteriovorax sp.]